MLKVTVLNGEVKRVRIKPKRMIAVKMAPFGVDPMSYEQIGVVPNSDWIKVLSDQQSRCYPSASDNLNQIENFYFSGSDYTVEFLCEGFFWEIIEE